MSNLWLQHQTVLGAAEAGLNRRGVGIVLYVSPDRDDIQFALSELTRLMNTRSERGMAILRRVLRCLAGTKGYGMLIPTPNPEEEYGDDDVLIYTDVNWAQDSRSEVCQLREYPPPRSCVVELCVPAEVAPSSGESEW